ncbi:phage portal protein [Burkholderia sp. Bp9017]|uniref:phage portal protein n=1 Tax=unclassified Burkholderia TaxID=2613784 RepID=UPI000F5DF190|nr:MULTISPECIES: phage portal protein [unclassified Burkholderia]RQZ24174.1 phage portal protein [Burkholderia sp. Bp9017]RQZ32144.1 phage portal protein [Burkholderia sp. Bp9016]
MKMNFFERMIASVSPEWGMHRMRARMALDAVRGFDGAKRGPRAAGWRVGGASANAELAPALATLRNRSRDLIRNNGYIKHALNVKVANLVGTGIRAKFADKKLQKLWKRWIKQCDAAGLLDFNGIQAQCYRAMEESGEVYVRFRVRLAGDGLDVPLQLQVLESDYLDSTRTGPTDSGGFIITGIQFDAIGRRVGYWFFDRHPGEIATVPRDMQSHFVPASEVIHLFDAIKRPGAVRGFPEFATSIWKVRDLDEYQDAELVRKKIEACFAAFVKTNDDSFQAGRPTSLAGAGGDGPRVEALSPGMIEYLRANEEVQFAAPAASNGYEEHVRIELRAIAAGADLTYEQLTGDYSQVNFTSGRMGKMEFKRIMEQKQWLIVIPMLCERVASRFVTTAYLAGRTKLTDCDVTWTPERIEFIDPMREASGLIALIEARLKSRVQGIRELGDDPEEVDGEILSDTLDADLPQPSGKVTAVTSRAQRRRPPVDAA